MGYDAVVIRRATIEDADQVSALTDAAYAQWVQLIGGKPLPMTTNYIDSNASHVVDVMENDGVMCGVLELVLEDDHALIESIAIHPDHQGNGLGGRLLEHAEKMAQTLSYSEVRLYTNASFTSNLKFYEAHGYEVLEKSAMIPGSITVHLHKML